MVYLHLKRNKSPMRGFIPCTPQPLRYNLCQSSYPDILLACQLPVLPENNRSRQETALPVREKHCPISSLHPLSPIAFMGMYSSNSLLHSPNSERVRTGCQNGHWTTPGIAVPLALAASSLTHHHEMAPWQKSQSEQALRAESGFPSIITARRIGTSSP